MPITQPKLIEAFFQANTVEGYGYLDVRGALARQFGSDFKAINEAAEENVTSLLFTQPSQDTQPVIELKINQVFIWLHFKQDVSQVSIRQESSRIVDAACALMGVTRLSRQGLRIYFLYPTQDAESAVRMLGPATVSAAPWHELGKVGGASLAVHLETTRLKANVNLRSVQRQARTAPTLAQNQVTSPADNSDLPDFGVLLDVDVYQEQRSDTRDPKPHINQAMHFVEDNIVPFVTRLLEERA